MKKLSLMVLGFLFITSMAFASPMTDYSKGNTTLDFTINPKADIDAKGEYDHHKYSASNLDGSKYSMSIGITRALSDKLAIQYKQQRPESKDYWIDIEDVSLSVKAKIESDEFNILYKLNPNVSLFAGIDKNQLKGTLVGIDVSGIENNATHIGIIGTHKFNDKSTLYGIASTSTYKNNFEIGVGYALSKDVEFNLTYDYTKYKKLELPAILNNSQPKLNLELCSIGYGLTFKL